MIRRWSIKYKYALTLLTQLGSTYLMYDNNEVSQMDLILKWVKYTDEYFMSWNICLPIL